MTVDELTAYLNREVIELRRENQQLRDEASDLRGFIEGMKKHIEAAAAMYGFKRQS